MGWWRSGTVPVRRRHQVEGVEVKMVGWLKPSVDGDSGRTSTGIGIHACDVVMEY